jgi:membrane protein required for colicin V production
VLLDAALLAFLAASAVLGALSGLLRPLFLFAGAALGWLAARHLAGPLGRILASFVPASAARPAAAVLLFLVVAGVVAYAGRRLSRNREGEGRPLDRAGGALLAGMAAAATAWVGLAVAEAAAPSLPGGWQASLSRSDLAALVRENDLLGDWRRRAETGLASLLRAAGAPGSEARLSADPDLRKLLQDPRVRALVEEARATGRDGVQRSPEALRLLSDPDFRSRLEAAQERLDRRPDR